jgi:hypothetical protein
MQDANLKLKLPHKMNFGTDGRAPAVCLLHFMLPFQASAFLTVAQFVYAFVVVVDLSVDSWG